MSKTHFNTLLGGLGVCSALMVFASSTPASAQSAGNLGGLPALGGGAPVARVVIGDGRTSNNPRQVIQVGGGSGTPLVGAGALSPGAHDGSAVSISAANTQRLAAVSAGSVNANNGATVYNPSRAPIFAGAPR